MMETNGVLLQPGDKRIPKPAYIRLLAYIQELDDFYQLLSLSVLIEAHMEQIRSEAARSRGVILPFVYRPQQGVVS